MSIFSKRLNYLMTANGIGQKEIATSLHCPVDTISDYVNGIQQPCFETVIEIAKLFNVTTDYLLGLSPHPFPLTNSSDVCTIRDIQEMLNCMNKTEEISKTYPLKFLKKFISTYYI